MIECQNLCLKGLAKNLNFSNLKLICMFLCKLWLNQGETTEKLQYFTQFSHMTKNFENFSPFSNFELE
jgi:hypothetical protein